MVRAVTLPPEGPLSAGEPRQGGWWHEVEDDGGRIACDLCPRGCSMGPGDRGFCYVRENRDGALVSTTYGRSTGFCIDPIEKKPLHQFYPGTAVLSFGTAGCNLGCRFCQNWTMSRARGVDAACEVAAPETIAAAARQLGCRSVAFTYNDPIVWAEYAIDTARACRAAGIKTVAVTSGYLAPAARGPFYEVMDAANVDLKAFAEDFYVKMTGGHLQPVLDTLRYIARETDTWLETTNLVIPRANDAMDQIARMCDWMVAELGPDVPLHFSAFHPDFKLTDRGPTPLDTLLAAHDVARRAGLRYVYTGNVSDAAHEATYCPGCGRSVIERDGYVLRAYRIRGGQCEQCGTAIAGRFDPSPGDWGGRRQPVRIGAYARPGTTPGATAGSSSSAGSPSSVEASGTTGGLSTRVPLLGKPAVAPDALHPKGIRPAVGSDALLAEPAVAPVAQPALSQQQERQVFRAAGCRVLATVRSQPAEPIAKALGDAASLPVYGAFVSLKRGGQLRSCLGYLGESVSLAEAVGNAATRAAKDDPRFPPISPAELDYLDMEVWVLWGPQPVMARGEDRAEAFTIGKHGLQIARGSARGLLLPGVAVEHHLDARGFLRQVCLKAGLPPDAWRGDDTTLMKFEGYAIRGQLHNAATDPPSEEMGTSTTPHHHLMGVARGDSEPVPIFSQPPASEPELPDHLRRCPPGGPTRQQVAALATFCRGNLTAMLRGATPSYYLAGGYDGAVSGLALTIGRPGSDPRIECSRLSLRSGMPLQATLFNLIEAAARVLQSRRTTVGGAPVGGAPVVGVRPAPLQSLPVGLTVLWDPALHGTVERPELQGVDPRQRAVLAMAASRSAWIYDPARNAEQLAEEAMQRAGIAEPAEARLVSLAAISTEGSVTIVDVPQPQPGPDVRPPAVAGLFYPGAAEKIQRALDEMFSAPPQPQPWSAAMVPHAGWIYSGRLAAKVFGRVQVPQQAIVLCPKHRPGGADWAVAPHRRWALPGMEVASDPELAARLAEAVTGLELDAAAHAREHAIEVQLPLLARMNPQVRVVGMVILDGGASLRRLLRFGEEMAEVLRPMTPRPLLVISTDMNHRADDARTRQVDRLALDAVESLDPARLYETVRKHDISMCGMVGAVIVMETLRRLDGLNRCELVGYATSADAGGAPNDVVGYAGLLLG